MSISFSKIKLYYECPYKYKLYYIDKIPFPSGPAAVFGQAIHSLFKDIIIHKYDRKKAIALWRRYYEKETITNNDSVEIFSKDNFWVGRGYPVIQLFFNNIDKLKIKNVIAVEERKKSVYKNEEISYVCDLVYQNLEDRIILLDYKTGKQKEVDYYQLEFYSTLLGFKIDEHILYYAFKGIQPFAPGTYKLVAEKYIDNGIKMINSNKFSKNITKDCKNCYYFMKKECLGEI